MQVVTTCDLTASNTLALPCVADFKVIVECAGDIAKALAFADEKKLPWLVLGQGSNVVLPEILHAVVISVEINGFTIDELNDDQINICVGAGEPWHNFVESLLKRHIYGLENLALIPGLTGAAPVQNIGAYGCEIGELITSVEVFDLKVKGLVTLTAAECEFAYRSSIFKLLGKDRYIITRINLALSKNKSVNIKYTALASELKTLDFHSPSPKDVFDAVVSIRSQKLPNPAVQANAGSFFKNPIVDQSDYQRLLKIYPDIAAYPQADGTFKLAAAWLIDQAGWKGKAIGNVATHTMQALVLVNKGGATQTDILAYAAELSGEIYQRYQVQLQREPIAYNTLGVRLS